MAKAKSNVLTNSQMRLVARAIVRAKSVEIERDGANSQVIENTFGAVIEELCSYMRYNSSSFNEQSFREYVKGIK